jgi:hypothetical protein
MRLAPGPVVVIVNAEVSFAADDPAHALNHPLASGIGIQATKLQSCKIAPPRVAF